MMNVPREGHKMATVHQWQQMYCWGCRHMLQAASRSELRSFPPLRVISILYLKDNGLQVFRCSDILRMNEESSGCWQRLWRSPRWRIEVRLTINPRTGRASSEHWQRFQQKRNPTWVYLHDCNQLAKSRWVVVRIVGFGTLLGELLDP